MSKAVMATILNALKTAKSNHETEITKLENVVRHHSEKLQTATDEVKRRQSLITQYEQAIEEEERRQKEIWIYGAPVSTRTIIK